MNESTDSRERLRRAKPVRYEDAPAPDSLPAQALFHRITSTDPTAPRRQRTAKRRVAWVLVPIALLTAAAGYGLLHRVTQPLVVVCYEQPALGAPRAVVSASSGDPTMDCGFLWQAGGEFNQQGGKTAPPLAACLLDTGAVGVFPATSRVDPCTALGLAPAVGPAQNEEENEAVRDVRDSLTAAFLGRCVPAEEAVAIAKQELSRHGLMDWKVEIGQAFSAEEPCASPVYDAAARMITLIPVGDPSST